MAKMTVDQLTNALKQESYTPRTDEELRSAAEQRYNSAYNQKRLTAQQNYDTTDLAYQQQLKALQDTLAGNQQELLKNVADSLAAADRYTITRGMQRSSYGAANRANIQNKGNANLAALLKQYGTDASGIEGNRTLLARQLADTLASYDIDYQNDVLAYMDEQKQLDYDRKVAADQYANQLQMQLFEYNQKYGGGSEGGSGRRGGGTSAAGVSTQDANTSSLFDDLMAGTLGSSNATGMAYGAIEGAFGKPQKALGGGSIKTRSSNKYSLNTSSGKTNLRTDKAR